MSRSKTRRWMVAGAIVVVLLAVALWLDRRAQPDVVGPRFTEALLQRRPGTTVDAWNGGVMRVALPSGVYIDLRLRTLFDACRAARWSCSTAIASALDDVDRADRSTREPQRATLRPTIVDGAPPGYTLGYVTEPVVGRYELRYQTVDGLASTFVTLAMADRLGLSRAALKAEALAHLHADESIELEALPANASVFMVRSGNDPAALLLDRERMKAFAARIGSARLYAVMPAPGTLYLTKADEAGLKALTQVVPAGGFDVLACNVDGDDGALAIVARRP